MSVVFNADGTHLAIACEQLISVLEFPDGNVKRTFFYSDVPSSDRFVKVQYVDGALLAVTARGARFEIQSDLETTTVGKKSQGLSLYESAIPPDLSVLVGYLDEKKDVIVTDTRTGEVKFKLKEDK